jgi:hypothetical protein
MTPRQVRLLLAVMLAAWAWVLASYGTGLAGGADSSGYYNLARLLAQRRSTEVLRPVAGVAMQSYHPLYFTPLGFAPAATPGELVPVYPPGFPLHLALAAPIVGWDNAGVLVNVLAGIAALVLVYHLARRFELPPGWALASVVLFAMFPVTILYFTSLFSDGLATAWCAAAIACALAGHRSARFAALAGFSFGVAVLVRPTDALLLPALLVVLGRQRRALLAFAAGGLPVAFALGAYNLATYGKLLVTGYGDISSQLKLSYFFPRIAHFGVWIARFWTPVVVLLWIGVAYRALRNDRRFVLLAAWVVPFVGFYSFYYHSDRFWWYLRFLLPVLPAVLIGALLVARQLGELAVARWGSKRGVRPLIVALLVGVALWAVASSRHWNRFFRVVHLASREVEYPQGVAWMARQVPPDAAIACFQTSGAVYAYSRFPVIRYDILDQGSAARLAGELHANETPVFALLFEFEVPAFRERYGDAFVELGRSGRSSLWRLNN